MGGFPYGCWQQPHVHGTQYFPLALRMPLKPTRSWPIRKGRFGPELAPENPNNQETSHDKRPMGHPIADALWGRAHPKCRTQTQTALPGPGPPAGLAAVENPGGGPPGPQGQHFMVAAASMDPKPKRRCSATPQEHLYYPACCASPRTLDHICPPYISLHLKAVLSVFGTPGPFVVLAHPHGQPRMQCHCDTATLSESGVTGEASCSN